MSILIGLLTVIHVLVALCLIGLVLMQKSKDQGVGAAFGAGVFIRYAGAKVDLPSVADLHVGGFHIGGGVRVRF